MPRLAKPNLNWLPIELEDKYHTTDLDYEFCLKLFAQLQAAKRDNIPAETMRQWFIEFIRKGWTKNIVQKRYDALLCSKMYGAITFDDWVNSVEVMNIDEVNRILKQKIESIIAKGRYLKDKNYALSEEEKQAVDLATAKEIELKYNSGMYGAIEDYRDERRKFWKQKFGVDK